MLLIPYWLNSETIERQDITDEIINNYIIPGGLKSGGMSDKV